MRAKSKKTSWAQRIRRANQQIKVEKLYQYNDAAAARLRIEAEQEEPISQEEKDYLYKLWSDFVGEVQAKQAAEAKEYAERLRAYQNIRKSMFTSNQL